mmetsp:Transcript_7366/g.16805  ORF Transcript_7366/g.16805 Transcript_7366/m.16805 type:complete len:202 (+) Transcript_7366:470-1075(+)
MVVVRVNQHKRATGEVRPHPTAAKLPAQARKLCVLQEHLSEELTLATSIGEEVDSRQVCVRRHWSTHTSLDELGEGLILICSSLRLGDVRVNMSRDVMMSHFFRDLNGHFLRDLNAKLTLTLNLTSKCCQLKKLISALQNRRGQRVPVPPRNQILGVIRGLAAKFELLRSHVVAFNPSVVNCPLGCSRTPVSMKSTFTDIP